MNFAELLGCNPDSISGLVWQAINAGNFKHRVLNGYEQAVTQAQVAEYLASGGLSVVSDASVHTERQALWERCYKDSLVIPPFLVKPKNQPVRLAGRYVLPQNTFFEADFLAVVRAYLFDKYFTNLRSVAEFGCGTGHNLLALVKQQPDKMVIGLDWSEEALKKVTSLGIRVLKFDLFNPAREESYKLRGVGVLTIGALEQVGNRFEPFLNYLLYFACPSICVHLEPIVELYDENDPFDQLAIQYHRARGYLEGYLPVLQKLERDGLVEILALHRIPFGSFYHEAYTYIIWRPIL